MKKRICLCLSAVLLAGLLLSCSRSPRCWGDDKNKGIIVSDVAIACEPETKSANYIINDLATLQQLFPDSSFGSPCNTPAIDFTQHTLLGVYTKGQCSTKTIREVEKIGDEKKYNYRVTMRSCGKCKALVYSYNWVTVPRLPGGWAVTFEAREK